MNPRAALTQLANLVAEDLAVGKLGPNARLVADALEQRPELVVDLIDLLFTESGRKRRKQRLIDALAFMIEQSLEFLRYQLERKRPEATTILNRARGLILTSGQSGAVDAAVVMLVLSQFTSARIDVGEDLRTMMGELVERAGVSQSAISNSDPREDFTSHLFTLAEGLDFNPFQIYGHIIERMESFPDEHRLSLIGAFLQSGDVRMREVAIGGLFDHAASVRQEVAAGLEACAQRGLVSPQMLRRMISVRNWLPEGDRPVLDNAIKMCRQKGITCAAVPETNLVDLFCSAFDGAGAHSVFVTLKEGRKHGVASLLMKFNEGVRDAWANCGISKRDVKSLFDQIDTQLEIFRCTLDYVRTAAGHFLAVGLEAGHMPPFGLLEFTERVGLSNLHPAQLDVSELVRSLYEELPANAREAAYIDSVVRTNEGIDVESYDFFNSWFEDDAGLDNILSKKRQTRAKKIGRIFTEILEKRRLKWAESCAWVALALKSAPKGMETSDWYSFAILAHEILGERPVADFALLQMIADASISAYDSS